MYYNIFIGLQGITRIEVTVGRDAVSNKLQGNILSNEKNNIEIDRSV